MFWSFLLAAGSIYGVWLAGRSPRKGWLVCFLMEIPWCIWAIWINQPGFLLLCLFYAGVYLVNLRRSKETSLTEATG